MNTIKVNIKDKIAVLSLDRGRSNAMNSEMISELEADNQFQKQILD